MRKTVKRLIAGSLAAVFLIPGASCLAAEKTDEKGGITIEARYFKPDLKLNAKTKYDSQAVDFKNQLGIDADNVYEYRMFFGDKFRLSYTQFGLSGLRSVDTPVIYDRNAFSGAVDSRVDLKYAKATWFRPLSKSGNISFLFDVKAVDLKTRVHGNITKNGDNNAQATSDYRFRGALPTVGLAVKNKLGKKADFYAEASGLYVGKYGYVYDAEASLKFSISKNTALDAGYRIFDVNYKRNSDSADEEHAELKLNGPYFGIVHKF